MGLDCGLDFSNHISHVTQHARVRLKVTCRLKIFETAKLWFIETLVLYIFYYCLLLMVRAFRERTLEESKSCRTHRQVHFKPEKYRSYLSFSEDGCVDAVKLLPVEAVCILLTCYMVTRLSNLQTHSIAARNSCMRGGLKEARTTFHFPG
ncbi:hypothetical protein J6590_058825 [Homalodisca vitripennis]|nr:hypothetical protein J6590_058825 [Homalodisca vitripennis]